MGKQRNNKSKSTRVNPKKQHVTNIRVAAPKVKSPKKPTKHCLAEAAYLRDRYLAYQIARAWLHPSSYAESGYSKSSRVDNLINPISGYGMLAPKYAHTNYSVGLHVPAAGEPYGRVARIGGRSKNALVRSSADPLQADINAANDFAVYGKYAVDSRSSFPEMPQQEIKQADLVPVIVEVTSKDISSLPTQLINGTEDIVTPLKAQIVSGGTATAFNVHYELDRPTSNAGQLLLEFCTSAGVVRGYATCDMAAGSVSGAGSVNFVAVTTSSDVAYVKLRVTTAPSGDVLLKRISFVKTTATTPGTHTCAPLTGVDATFEGSDYLICWMNITDTPWYALLRRYNWDSLLNLVFSSQIVVSNTTPKIYLGGNQKKGIVSSPLYFNTPMSLLTNNTFDEEVKLEHGSGHTYIPDPDYLRFGYNPPAELGENFVMAFQVPSGSSTYQQFFITLNEIGMIFSPQSGIGSSMNYPNWGVYAQAVDMVSSIGWRATYNSDHTAAIKRLLAEGERFYHKHKEAIDSALSAAKDIAFAAGGMALSAL